MSGRTRRAALHKRSDSETNTLTNTIHSIHSNNSSVSQKTNEVSSCQSPAAATTPQGGTRSSSPATSAPKSGRLRPSASLDSLPPVTPLKIHKRFPSAVAVARDPPPTTRAGGAPLSNTPAGISTHPPDFLAPGALKLPKSILKKPSRTGLPPYTTEEYNQKSSSWVGNNSNDRPPSQARMNNRTLRIVGNSTSDVAGEEEEGGGVGDRFQHTVGRRRSASVPLSLRTAPRLSSDAESAPHANSAEHTIPDQRPSAPTTGSPSLARADDSPTQPLAPAKQFPAWARYFYGRRGGRASIIALDQERGGSDLGIGVAIFDPLVRRQRSDDSLLITEVIPPGATHHGPRRMASSSSIPGIDWIGTRTRDAESATMWSLPHLDQAPLTRFESLNRQLILFCLGFLLPFCWIIAAFLPLPPLERATKEEAPQSSNQQESSSSVNADQTPGYSPKAVERYENARWWRKINRMLSVVGLLVIGAIIALAAVAATRA